MKDDRRTANGEPRAVATPRHRALRPSVHAGARARSRPPFALRPSSFVLLLLLLASPAFAAPVPAPPEPPKRRVLVLDGRDFRLDPNALFVAGGEGPTRVRPETDGVADAVVDALTREPELAVLRPTNLARPREGRAERDIVARGFLHLGLELYRNLRLTDAIAALEKGVDASRADFLDVLAADLVSDLYLYLGLSYLEQGNTPLAHVAFKQMFFVTPDRRFKKGYFPPDTESAIRAAAVDFVRTFPLEQPFVASSRVVAFRAASGVSAVVYAFVHATPSGDRLSVRFFESGDRDGTSPVSSTWLWGGAEPLRETAARAVSRWIACTSLPSREREKDLQPRFFVDMGGAYGLFTRHPTRGVFHTTGFGAGFAWQAVDELDTFLRMNVMTSFADRYGDLIEGFTSFRLVGGVGYSGRWSWGRVFLHFGFEMQYLSDFVSATDPNCKFFGTSSDWCSASDVQRMETPILVGGNLSLGTNLYLGGPVFLSFQAGMSAYFYPFGKNTPLNFPFNAELGLGYAFF